MQLQADQQVRWALLQKALETHSNCDTALEVALRMERFVLFGNMRDEPADGAEDPPAAENPDGPARTAKSGPRITGEGTPKDGRTTWGKQDDARLRDLWSRGLSAEQIARALDRSSASIYQRVYRIGLPRRVAKCHAGSKSGGARADHAAKPAASPALGAETPDESVGIDRVIHFLRTRDYSVVQTDDGRYSVDGRKEMTAEALFEHANRVREQIGRPKWTGNVLANVVAGKESRLDEAPRRKAS